MAAGDVHLVIACDPNLYPVISDDPHWIRIEGLDPCVRHEWYRGVLTPPERCPVCTRHALEIQRRRYVRAMARAADYARAARLPIPPGQETRWT